MTKKDYLRAVNTIRFQNWVSNKNERECLIQTFVDFFKGDNPRFDEDRFRQACQK